ncbi:MAG: alcohol dehydrogenase [Pseudomonadota bacterium]|jgi:PQQ-dependent dehydrogenase (methanol/ethanol family)
MRRVLMASLGGLAAFAFGVSRLQAATEWPLHGGDSNETRFSPLKQVNADNVAKLGLAWYADLSEKGQWQSTPVVVDGRIYVTTPWSKVYAYDAATGKTLWKFDPKVPREIAATRLCCNNSNRGVTYYKGKLLLGTLDGRLVAIDAKRGGKVWETRTTDIKDDMSITGAPRVGNGLVFIGQGGGEYFQRGYMSAYDADTGKFRWKFYVVPGDPSKGPDHAASDSVMPMAARTWSGEWWKTGGGGSPWDGIVYDEKTGLVIFGTGNGAPWPAEDRSPGGGDNLFIASIVALDAKTGEYRWHYQTVPEENFDFDNTSPLTTTDLVINGEKKHVVMQIPKNGVFYVIEAATGKVLSAKLAVPYANWLTGFDKDNNWKPILNPDANYGKTKQGWYVTPFQTHVWYPQSYNPGTGLVYVGLRYATFGFVAELGAKMGNQLLGINIAKRPQMGPPPIEGPGQWLSAWDPVAQREVWRAKDGVANSGTMTTAGNLVFQGTGQRDFSAFRADNGEKLWTTDAGASVQAGSVTYQVGATQYVAVLAGQPRAAGGNRLLVYKLGGSVVLPPVAPPAPLVVNAPENFGDADTLDRGRQLWQQNCTLCHEGGRGMGGFPDLRYSALLQSDVAFRSVVLDGVLTENGMLSFAKTLKAPDVEAIRAWVTKLANDVKDQPAQPAMGPGTGRASPSTAPPAPQRGLHGN